MNMLNQMRPNRIRASVHRLALHAAPEFCRSRVAVFHRAAAILWKVFQLHIRSTFGAATAVTGVSLPFWGRGRATRRPFSAVCSHAILHLARLANETIAQTRPIPCARTFHCRTWRG